MSRIAEAVEKAIKEGGGGESVLDLWHELWETYEESGIEGVEEVLYELVQSPEDE